MTGGRYSPKALSDVTLRLGRSPIEDLFGFTIEERGGFLSLDLPWSSWIADTQGEPAIARGVTATVMDHALGLASSASQPGSPPSTTIDLRVDWSRPFAPGLPASVTVEQVVRDGDIFFARATMRQDDEASPCATGVGRFLAGVFPGRSSMRDSDDDETAIDIPASNPRFSTFLGLEPVQGGRFVVPGAVRLAGMPRVGAFHGGLIAGSSDEAAQHVLCDWIEADDARCASLEIEYLRPAFTSDALLVDAKLLRAGRRSAVVEITTRQKQWDNPVLTVATALWVKEAPRPA